MWGLEKLLNAALDLAVPVLGTLLLLFWAPVLGALSVVRRAWNWLRAPTLRGKVVLISGASSGIGEVRDRPGKFAHLCFFPLRLASRASCVPTSGGCPLKWPLARAPCMAAWLDSGRDLCHKLSLLRPPAPLAALGI